VAAIPALSSGSFAQVMSGGGTLTAELYSSQGPRKMFFAYNGWLLNSTSALLTNTTGGVTRLKPDITAADCVVSYTFGTFCGTSAAVGQAGAMAADLLSYSTGSNPPGVMRNTAIPASTSPSGPGEWDRVTGYGVIDAVYMAGSVTPMPFSSAAATLTFCVFGNIIFAIVCCLVFVM